MNNLLRTALLLEEKAANLPRESVRRAELLALAKATRILALKDVTPEYCALRAEYFELTARSFPEGSQERKDYLAKQCGRSPEDWRD